MSSLTGRKSLDIVALIATVYVSTKLQNSVNKVKLILGSLIAWVLYKTAAAKPPKGAAPKGLPRHLPWFGHLLLYPKFRTHPHESSLELSRQCNFQSFCLMFPDNLVNFLAHDEEDRKWILKTNFENYQKRYDHRLGLDKVFSELFGQGIFAVDGDQWRTHRKIASNLFTGRMIGVTMAKVFAEHAQELKEVLLQYAREGKSFDIQLMLQSLVFDAFCQIAFSISPHSFQRAVKGEKETFQVAFDQVQCMSGVRLLDPPLWREFKKAAKIGDEATFETNTKILDDYVYKIIRDRKQQMKEDPSSNEKYSDILGLYLEHAYKQNRSDLTDDVYLRDLIINFMVAGRDTTSYVTTNILSLLAEHPEVNEELVAQIKAKKSKGLENFIENELKDFPLADAIFNESLRLYPSVGTDVRFAQKDDVLPSGIKITAGTQVLIPNLAIGRNPKYSSDPDEFIPHRWLKTVDGHTVCDRIDEYKFPFFWGGYRICLGKDMARFEAKLFMAVILDTIKFSLAKPREEVFLPGPVMFYENGMHLRAEERS